MINLFFHNGLQLAFIALPFQSRVGANLFSVDIKGQFIRLLRKYFSYLFIFRCRLLPHRLDGCCQSGILGHDLGSRVWLIGQRLAPECY